MKNQKKIIQGYVPTVITCSPNGNPLLTKYVNFYQNGLTYDFKEAQCFKKKEDAIKVSEEWNFQNNITTATPVNGLCELINETSNVKVKSMKQKPTKAGYEHNYLNEVEIPYNDLKSNGGRIPDHAKYGTWLRKNDPVAFQVGYNEYCRK